MAKYVGPNSCYARHEGAYVPRIDDPETRAYGGVTLATYASILALIMRDAYRGYSYDDRCRRISFGWPQAKSRAQYLVALCYRHSPRDICDVLKKALPPLRVIEERRLPRGIPVYLEGPRAADIGKELVRLGIAEPEDIIVNHRPLTRVLVGAVLH